MSERFVVVGGSPRSGTSLLRTILKSSDALCVHTTEPHYIFKLYYRFGHTITDVQRAIDLVLAHEKFPRAEIDSAALQDEFKGERSLSLSEFLTRCLRLLKRTNPDRLLVLKHPGFLLHLDLVKTLFPDLLVVHSIRDPRANVLSQRTRWPSTGVWEAASRWRASVRAGRRWRDKGTTPYLEVQYEDLLKAPEATCRALCHFLGIPFDGSMLTVDHVEREWDPANPGLGSKRIYQAFEQQRIDKWKTFSTPLEVKLIEDHCREEMRWFGYETTNPRVALSAYAPYYFEERQKAVRKSITRLRRRIVRAVGT